MKRYNSLQEIRKDISEGSITCRSLTEYYLKNIKSKAHLNAYVDVYEEEALATAEKVDAKIKAGTAGKLAGMVDALSR